MKNIFASTLFFGYLILSSQSLFAWGDLGHAIVGDVAEQNLKPTTKLFVRGILGIEPFSVSAVWPDHARDDERFGHLEPKPADRDADIHDFADYHFCEVPTNYDYFSKPNKEVKDCYGAITGAIAILKDFSGRYHREEKMIALRYLIHVMGDIHQPLHVGNGFDRGANACEVRWQKSPKEAPYNIDLHALWDSTLVEYLAESLGGKYLSVLRDVLKDRHKDLYSQQGKDQYYGAGDISSWLTESQQLRESGVYPDDPAQMKDVPKGEEYKHRPYCKWFANQKMSTQVGPGSPTSIEEAKKPIVGEDYAKRFSPIVEMQLIKGGLRLAHVLDSIADSLPLAVAISIVPSYTSITDEVQDKILQSVQDAFRNKISN